jgi:hypothetical protein
MNTGSNLKSNFGGTTFGGFSPASFTLRAKGSSPENDNKKKTINIEVQKKRKVEKKLKLQGSLLDDITID